MKNLLDMQIIKELLKEMAYVVVDFDSSEVLIEDGLEAGVYYIYSKFELINIFIGLYEDKLQICDETSEKHYEEYLTKLRKIKTDMV